MNQIKLSEVQEPKIEVGQFYLVNGNLHILARVNYDDYGDRLFCLLSLETGQPLEDKFTNNKWDLLDLNYKFELVTSPFEVIPGN